MANIRHCDRDFRIQLKAVVVHVSIAIKPIVVKTGVVEAAAVETGVAGSTVTAAVHVAIAIAATAARHVALGTAARIHRHVLAGSAADVVAATRNLDFRRCFTQEIPKTHDCPSRAD